VSKAAKKGGHVTVESIRSLQNRKKGRFFGVGARRRSM